MSGGHGRRPRGHGGPQGSGRWRLGIVGLVGLLVATACPAEPTEPTGSWQLGDYGIAVSYGELRLDGPAVELDARSVDRATAMVAESTEPTLGDAMGGPTLLGGIPLINAVKQTVAAGGGSSSLSELGLSAPGGWSTRLPGVSPQATPISSLTSGAGPAALAGLTVADVSLRTSPMRKVPILPLLFDATPLSAFPLADGDAYTSWCTFLSSLADPTVTCAALGLQPSTTIGQATIRGVPMRKVPMRKVPMRKVPWQSTPLGTRNVAELGTDSSLAMTLLNGIDVDLSLGDLNLALQYYYQYNSFYVSVGGALRQIPLSALGHRTDGLPDPFASIRASELTGGDRLACLPGCGSLSLLDLTDAQLDKWDLGRLDGSRPLGRAPALTMRDLLASLGWTNGSHPPDHWARTPTFGDVIVAAAERDANEQGHAVYIPGYVPAPPITVAGLLRNVDADDLADVPLLDLVGGRPAPADAGELDRDALATSNPMTISVTAPAGTRGVVELPAETYIAYRADDASQFTELRTRSVPFETSTVLVVPRPVSNAKFTVGVTVGGAEVARRDVEIGGAARAEPTPSHAALAGLPELPDRWWQAEPGRTPEWGTQYTGWYLWGEGSSAGVAVDPASSVNDFQSWQDEVRELDLTPLGQADVAIDVGCDRVVLPGPTTAPSRSIRVRTGDDTRANGVAQPQGCRSDWIDAGGVGTTESLRTQVKASGSNTFVGGKTWVHRSEAPVGSRDVLMRSTLLTTKAHGYTACEARQDPSWGPVGQLNAPWDSTWTSPFAPLRSLAPGIKRLLVTNSQLVEKRFAASATLNQRLTTFVAAHPDTAVLDVATTLPHVGGTMTGDGDPCAPVDGAYRDGKVSPRADLVREYLQSIGGAALSEIVLVGAWDVIPPGYVADPTKVGSEWERAEDLSTRAPTLPANYPTRTGYVGLEAKIAAGSLIPTDDVYGSLAPGDLSAADGWVSPVYLPSVSVSRLVDTPAQIITQLNEFDSRSATILGARGSVAAYDFLEDSGAAVGARLTAQGRTVDASLLGGSWTGSTFLAKWFPTSGPTASIRYLGAHFNESAMLTASGNFGGADAIVTADSVRAKAADGSLAGSLIVTVGCHSGVSAPFSQDWAETFSAARVGAFVGVTTYGYGDTEQVAFSERLADLFVQQLNRSATVGEAFRRAKSLYVAERGTLSSYDYKVLASMTLYGMAGYRVANPNGSLPVSQPPTVATEGLASGSSVSAASQAEGNSVVSNAFVARPQLDAVVTGPKGRYYSASGGVTTNSGEPVLPRASIDAGRSGLDAKGVVIEAISSQSVEGGFDPWFIGPSRSDQTAGAEPSAPGAFPVALGDVSTSGVGQRLNVIAGRYVSGGGSTGSFERFSQLSGRIYYGPTNGSDDLAPSVGDGFASNPSSYSVLAQDPSGILAVVVLYRTPTGTWATVRASAGSGDRWNATLAGSTAANPASGYVQVVDRAGNVRTVPFHV